MKKIVILLPLIFLVGCTNKVEENKYSYLEYKRVLEQKEEFTDREKIDFNTYFNIERENEEVVNYSIVINLMQVNEYLNICKLLHIFYGHVIILIN